MRCIDVTPKKIAAGDASLVIETGPYGGLWLEIDQTGNGYDRTWWLSGVTSAEARSIAAALVDAADELDRAK